MLRYLPAPLAESIRRQLGGFVDARTARRLSNMAHDVEALERRLGKQLNALENKFQAFEETLGQKLQGKLAGRRPNLDRAGPPPGAQAHGVNRSDTTIDDVVAEIKRGGYRSIAVYSDQDFLAEFCGQLSGVLPQGKYAWLSSHFRDIAQGADRPEAIDLDSYDCVVIGGRLAKLYHPRLLKIMAQKTLVRPVFVAGESFEFCVGQISLPAEIDDAHVYLFNHFFEFFAIRDPILARLEVYDQHSREEQWLLMKPGESIRIHLAEWFPQRTGPAAMAVSTSAPVLTRGRHYRWRFCIDVLWNGSLCTLHGVHDIGGVTSGTEFMQSRSSFSEGKIVFILPNHYADMSEQAQTVECLDGGKRFEIKRDPAQRVDQVELPANNSGKPAFGDFIGCRFQQYTTPYWFALERVDGRPNLSGNHIIGQSFAFLDQAPPTKPLGDLEKSLLAQDVVTWPYALPVLPDDSNLEMGFNFDSSWPQLKQFAVRYFDKEGTLRHSKVWTKTQPGIVYADELVAAQNELAREEIGILLVSPDWQGLNLDQQANGISILADFALRHRRTRDYDVTEYQNCWRNLGMIIDEMPHWIHFSNHILGGTNLYGRATAMPGWRAGMLLVNGSGNLRYRSEVDYVVKLFDRSGRMHETERSIKAFTHQLVWLDEVFPNLSELLSPDGYGAVVIRSRNGDLNGQLVTVKDDSAVSLQHMWGY